MPTFLLEIKRSSKLYPQVKFRAFYYELLINIIKVTISNNYLLTDELLQKLQNSWK